MSNTSIKPTCPVCGEKLFYETKTDFLLINTGETMIQGWNGSCHNCNIKYHWLEYYKYSGYVITKETDK